MRIPLLPISHCLPTSAGQDKGTRQARYPPSASLSPAARLDLWPLWTASTQRPGFQGRIHPKARFSWLAFNKACYRKQGHAFLQDWLSAGSWALKQPPCSTLTLSLPVFWWVALTPRQPAQSFLSGVIALSTVTGLIKTSRPPFSALSGCFLLVFLSPWHLRAPPGIIHTACVSLINVNTSQCEN